VRDGGHQLEGRARALGGVQFGVDVRIGEVEEGECVGRIGGAGGGPGERRQGGSGQKLTTIRHTDLLLLL
jgi:hypothetical protein